MTERQRKAYEIPESEVAEFFERRGERAILSAALDTLPPEFHYLVRLARNAAEAPRGERPTWPDVINYALRFQLSIRTELLNVIPEERALKQRAFTRVHQLCLQYKIIHPEVTFKLKGTTAGRANKDIVRVNLILLAENPEDMLGDTIPHELCHTWKHQLGLPGKPHGNEWKGLMRRMGVQPSVCHSMDTTRAAAKPLEVYTYTCKCKTKHPLTRREQQALEIARINQYNAFCRYCGELIEFVGVDNMPNRLILAPSEVETDQIAPA